MHQRCLPPGATPIVSSKTTGTTLAGTFAASRLVTLDKILLPKFHRSRRIDTHDRHVFNATCPYDIIIGRDLLVKIRMGFDFHAMTLSAFGTTVAMKPNHFYNNPFAALLDILFQTYEDSAEENLSSYYASPKQITESRYEKVDVDAVVKEQKTPFSGSTSQAFGDFPQTNRTVLRITWSLST
jgi:hypothetical protein